MSDVYVRKNPHPGYWAQPLWEVRCRQHVGYLAAFREGGWDEAIHVALEHASKHPAPIAAGVVL